jgi:hypothetical protein
MKIIKEGAPKSKIYRFGCKNCGCIYDLDYRNIDDRRIMDLGPFMNEIFVSSRCPCCLERVYGSLLEEEEDADS